MSEAHAPETSQDARGRTIGPRSVHRDQPPDAVAPRRRLGRRPKDIGTEGESWVTAYLRDHGWPNAERRALAGSQDRGDIGGCGALAFEVKAGRAAKSAGPKQVQSWLDETERERLNAGADVGLLVMARAGYGRQRVGMWWALVPLGVLLGGVSPTAQEGDHVWMTLETACRWLHWLGYGRTP